MSRRIAVLVALSIAGLPATALAHCDTLDGPVVKASRTALETGKLNAVLAWVRPGDEAEVKAAFARVLTVRKLGPEARELADTSFFETVVRVHRAGEGAPYTGLKPAGLGHGPVIPVAEKAIETGSPDELIRVLSDLVHEEVKERFERVMELQKYADGPVPEAREYVEMMLDLQVWAHTLYLAIRADAWEHGGPGSLG